MILVNEGESPVILCLPHSGTDMPEAVSKRLNATGRLQADLSWQLDRVFDFHHILNVTVIRSTVSRYVIDLDKPVGNGDGEHCPVTTLDGKRIYQEGEEPGPTEIEQRELLFYDPFHKALRHQLDRLNKKHGKVILLDCQSMRSHIKGVTGKGLPLVSVGSMDGKSTDPDLRNLLVGSFQGLPGFTISVDEHAKGGFITRTLGQPDRGVHAMSLLLAQRAYLRHESPPFEPDKTRVERLREVLQDMLTRLIDWTALPDKNGNEASSGEVSQEPEADSDPSGEMSDDEVVAPNAEETEHRQEAEIEVDPVDASQSTSNDSGEPESGVSDELPEKPLLVAE